jgi:DNA mismatch repair protein MSH6
VTTKGTRLYLAIEGDAVNEDCSYLIAVTEGVNKSNVFLWHQLLIFCVSQKSNENNPVFGVCFVDTSIGHFQIGQFEDDRHKSQLRMLLAQYPPTQVC